MNDMPQLNNYVFNAGSRSRPCRSPAATRSSRSTASTASAATSPTTPIEMGHDPNKEPPFFFQKNPDTLVLPGTTSPIRARRRTCTTRSSWSWRFKKGGTNIPLDKALDYVFGYGVGLDMTRRDLQGEAKKLGRPWETGKAFEASAPCSVLHPVSKVGHPTEGAIWLKVNGEIRQNGDLNQMIWKVPEMISYLSRLFELKAGDLIFAGTPAGVGAVVKGDEMVGHVDGVDDIRVRVA